MLNTVFSQGWFGKHTSAHFINSCWSLSLEIMPFLISRSVRIDSIILMLKSAECCGWCKTATFVPGLKPDIFWTVFLLNSVDIPEVDLFPMWGPGYAIPSDEGNEAISMLMKNEGIVIDTCYTGKAFAGLIKRAREGFFKPEDKILFIHTGGAGGLFSQDWEHISLYKTWIKSL